MPTNWVLLPGSIVPGDGSRDDAATVDVGFHGPDRELLTALGVVAGPQSRRDLSNELCYGWYRDAWRAAVPLTHRSSQATSARHAGLHETCWRGPLAGPHASVR